MKRKVVKILPVFIIISLFLMGCNDNPVSKIPNVPVNLKLNLTTTYPTFKNSMNQYLLFEKPPVDNTFGAVGYGGVLVCSGLSLDDYGNTQYYAFDMTCPYEADKDVKVYPDDSIPGEVKCEKCGSTFDVGYGTGLPLSGPAYDAKQILKKYHTSLNGDYLIVYR